EREGTAYAEGAQGAIEDTRRIREVVVTAEDDDVVHGVERRVLGAGDDDLRPGVAGGEELRALLVRLDADVFDPAFLREGGERLQIGPLAAAEIEDLA